WGAVAWRSAKGALLAAVGLGVGERDRDDHAALGHAVAVEHGARHARALGHRHDQAVDVLAAQRHDLRAAEALVVLGEEHDLAPDKAGPGPERADLEGAVVLGRRVGEGVTKGAADVGQAEAGGIELDADPRAHARVDAAAQVDAGLELDQELLDVLILDDRRGPGQGEQVILTHGADLPFTRAYPEDLEVAVARGRLG